MSEFINKAKIADLQHANAELRDEVETLRIELENVTAEMTGLKGTPPDEINHLREKIFAYEQREAEFNGRILSFSKDVANSSYKGDIMSQLLSVLQVAEAGNVETAITHYYKNKWRPKIITSFLLGLLVAIVFWIVVTYLGNHQHYNEVIEQLITTVF
ncbi:hypothetical protein [uncultured Desulfuromusa sp.]|uniref:hypothetical protein n=1 Tax=uncultured Desulfuromusa sp. TaxID=219183 RepID=UPI002AA6CB1C|nr:hypothetical protein [uncultured Desulfuromusa sp.]